MSGLRKSVQAQTNWKITAVISAGRACGSTIDQ